MRSRARTPLLAAVLGGALALAMCVYAAIALADVVVYSNTLTSERDGNELHNFQGKAANCSRHVTKGSLMIIVTGKDICGYRLPLEGDGPQPNHSLHARVKLGKQTPKALRRKSFLGVGVRVGGGTGYTLRLLPTRHQFALRRLPSGKGFNKGGKDAKIKGLNKWNDIRLQAIGTKVTAVVNGKTVASVTDADAKGVTGRKAEIFAGANKANSVGTTGRVDDVRLAVPSP
jgi:hypothetical protein